MRDLEGLTVVTLEHAVAAPYASMKLADAGARVIKVERPEGDFARNYDALVKGQSAYFVWLNRGKQSVALDLKDPQDSAILRTMIRRADIFIQNLGPGVLARLGFAGDALLAENPGLILCSISGYGNQGPRASQKAYDLLIQAESGLSSITGIPEGAARVGVSVCDIAAGMTAYQAILQALIGRAKTGKGRQIEVSMFQAMADWMNVPYLQFRYGGKAPDRMGLRHPTIAPYGLFSCADERALLIAVQNDREWRALCTAFGQAALADHADFRTNNDRVRNRTRTDAMVQTWLESRSREDNIALLDAARIAFGRLSDMADIASHPQAAFSLVSTAAGPIELLSPGAVVLDNPMSDLGVVPGLDEHGQALRQEFAAD